MRLKFYEFKKVVWGLSFLLATFSLSTAQTYTVGAATGVGNGSTTFPTGFAGWFGGARHQMLYTVAQLNAAGIPAGSAITQMGFNVLNVNSCPTLLGYTIGMKHTGLTTLTGTETGFTVVKNPSNVTPVVGWNMMTLDNNFVWDGVSNLLIETCLNNNNGGAGTGNTTCEWNTSVGYNSVRRVAQDNNATVCTNSTNTVHTNLPRIRFEVVASPCAGAPTGGTAVASVAASCPSVNFSIDVTGASIGSGITFQWQISTDGGFTWNNIAGATNNSFSGTQNATSTYRRRIICTAGPDTAYTNTVSVTINPFYNCYCTTAFPSNVEPISLVQFNTINNATSNVLNATPAQEDFTAMSTDIIQGFNYPITVNGNTDGNFTNYLAAYFDWNQNGLYTDPGETYQLGSIYGCANCGVTGNISIPLSALPGTTGMRITKKFNAYADACNVAGFGQTEDYTVNVLPPPADEAGVLAITKPGVSACSLGNEIWVNLQNLGTNDLTSATFTMKVNGLNIPVNPWTGNVPAQSNAEIQLPVSYPLADGDSIAIEVSMPNGVVENPLLAFNNATARRVYAGLSGNKTVYGVGANYADIPAVLVDLYLRGVCDTVYFKIASDTLTTQHTFLSYPGAGAGRLVVFESATGNAGDVVFKFSATGTANNFIFKFDGGDGYMIRNLTAVASGAAFATIADIRNGADDISFEGNTFIGDTIGTNVVGDFDRVVIASVQGTTDHRTTLKNNNVIGGTRAIILAAATGSFEEGHVFENNNVINNTAMAALLGSVSYPVVTGNTFNNRNNVTGEAYNIIVNGSIDGASFDGNELSTSRAGANLYLINAKGGVSEFMISNNFINTLDTANLSRAVWIENVASSGIALVNNSISYHSNNTGVGAVTILDGSQIRLFNNNVGAFGNAPIARIEKSYSVSASDNNNLFGTNLANIVGVVYSTLPTLQAATGFDASSKNVNPGFNGTDLHTCVADLNSAGMPLAFVSNDIDGDLRGTTPDIGADEFMGDANNLLVEDAFLKCPADQVTIGNTALDGITYTWTPSGNTSEITTSNAGTFVVTATSSCGSFSDTATVVNKPLPTASFTSYAVSLAAAFTNNSTNGTSYLWDFGDGSSSTDEDPTHIYSSAGTYSVILTVTNDCGTATFGPTAVNVINAGIEENTNVNVSLFPNPTNGQFTVTMSAVNSDATSISVIDVTGKVVMVKNMAAGINQVTLDATTFASGVYSVKISNGQFTKVVRLVRK